jgi:hypothetical protein
MSDVSKEGEDPWLCGPGFRQVCYGTGDMRVKLSRIRLAVKPRRAYRRSDATRAGRS